MPGIFIPKLHDARGNENITNEQQQKNYAYDKKGKLKINIYGIKRNDSILEIKFQNIKPDSFSR